MFNAQQLAYMRVLASQSAGNTQVGFNRTRLLVRSGASAEDHVALLFFISLAGILLSFFVAGSLWMREWVMTGICATLLAGVGWGARRALANQAQAQQQPPSFIFDSTQHCFFVLAARPKGEPARYDRYPSHLVRGSRVRILKSTQYFDETVIEFTFDNKRWVTALELNNSPLAYELERAIKYCQAMRHEH